MELEEVGTIIKQEFKLWASENSIPCDVYLQCEGCSESTTVENLDEAIKWADEHEQSTHLERGY